MDSSPPGTAFGAKGEQMARSGCLIARCVPASIASASYDAGRSPSPALRITQIRLTIFWRAYP
jgi:hypothetical protein